MSNMRDILRSSGYSEKEIEYYYENDNRHFLFNDTGTLEGKLIQMRGGKTPPRKTLT